MAGKKSLSDLGALTGQEPETPTVAETPAAETATVEASETPESADSAPSRPRGGVHEGRVQLVASQGARRKVQNSSQETAQQDRQQAP